MFSNCQYISIYLNGYVLSTINTLYPYTFFDGSKYFTKTFVLHKEQHYYNENSSDLKKRRYSSGVAFGLMLDNSWTAETTLGNGLANHNVSVTSHWVKVWQTVRLFLFWSWTDWAVVRLILVTFDSSTVLCAHYRRVILQNVAQVLTVHSLSRRTAATIEWPEAHLLSQTISKPTSN